MSRRAVLAVIAAISVLAAGAGWVAGQRIKSPLEVASETAPPEPSLITVPVVEQKLSSRVVMRASVEFSDSTNVVPSGSTTGATVITRVTKERGQELAEGDVIVEVAGRPVIALQGGFEAYRDFNPGSEGPDVLQLEQALERMGLNPGTVDNNYDAATEAAVEALFAQAGYSAEKPTRDQLRDLDDARSTLRAAQTRLSEARKGAGAGGVAVSERLGLDQEVTAARDALRIAQLDAAASKVAAEEVRVAAESMAAAAEVALQTAKNDLAEAESLGTSGEEELDLLRSAVAQAAAEVAAAQATVTDTKAIEVRTGLEQETNLASLESSVRIAEARRTEALAAPASNSGGSNLNDLKADVTSAQQRLNELDAATGTKFSAAEIVFLPRLPQTIETVSVKIGDNLGGPVMRITGSKLRVRGAVADTDRRLLSEGLIATIDDRATGVEFEAELTLLNDTPGGDGLNNDRFAVEFTPVGDVPEEAIDKNLRVTIPFGSSSGEVLAVPPSALSASVDGSSRVEVERSPGTTEFVTVVPGLNSRVEGLVEISPVDGDLVAGDRVVVGRGAGEQPASSDDSSEEPDEDPES